VVAKVAGGYLWADTRSPYNFGVQALGSNTKKTITFKNRGNANVTISAVALSGNGFSIVSEACSTVVLNPGESCPVTTRFAPVAGGFASRTLTVNSDDPVSPTFSVVLQGTGDAPRLVLSGSLDFGDVAVGNASRLTLTLRNRGTQTLDITSILETSSQFSIVNNACGATLAADDTCNVRIEFAPTSAGAKNAVVRVTSDDPQQAVRSAALRGNGI
jgi:hypothetical protein